VVLIAKNREAIQDMMSMLKEFLKDRQLGLNVEKSKVLVFNSFGIIERLKYKCSNI